LTGPPITAEKVQNGLGLKIFLQTAATIFATVDSLDRQLLYLGQTVLRH
jgi:hypothetical protein